VCVRVCVLMAMVAVMVAGVRWWVGVEWGRFKWGERVGRAQGCMPAPHPFAFFVGWRRPLGLPRVSAFATALRGSLVFASMMKVDTVSRHAGLKMSHTASTSEHEQHSESATFQGVLMSTCVPAWEHCGKGWCEKAGSTSVIAHTRTQTITVG
jgi:hypothetical protein